MKKTFVILFLFVSSISIGQTTYYVSSSDGSDSDSGLTPALAWATLTYVDTKNFVAGDSVLFKCGDEWRECLWFDGGTTDYVTYSSYGIGAKPLFLAQAVDVSGGWTNVAGNVWEHDTSLFSADVGNLIFNKEQYIGHMENDSSLLNAQGDWFYSFVSDHVWLYSVGNPGTFYTTIDAAIRPPASKWGWAYPIDNEDYVIIDGLDFRYSGMGGITGYNCSNVIIRNCNHSYNGGCYSNGAERSARIGGGIGTWGNVTNWLVENCTIDNEYDAGGTNQYTSSTIGVVLDSIVWRNNLITNSEYGWEFFIRPDASTVRALYFDNNTVAWSGWGWGNDERPDGSNASAVRNVLITLNKSEIHYRNNIFYMAKKHLFLLGPLTDIDNTVWDYNLVYNIGYDYASINGTLYSSFASWKTVSGKDIHSISQEPLFVSTTDFNLQQGSPCIDAGIDIGLPFNGSAPDFGAYESDYSHGITFSKDSNGNFLRDSNGNFIKIIQ